MAAEKIRIEYVVDKKQLDASNKSLQDAQKQNNLTQKEIDETTSKYKNQSKELGGLGGTMKMVGATFAGLFAVSKLIEFGKGVVNVTANFQKMEAVLTNTLGSSSKAKKALDDIQKFAAVTPFSVNGLTDSFIRLANQGFVPTTDEMRKLGDLASSTGKEFSMLTEALIDAQVGEFERLKEFGIRSEKQGDKVKFTFKGVQTQVDFTADSIQKYLLGLGDVAGVSGAMAAISATAAGKISNLGDNFEMLQKNIGDRSSGLISGMLTLANDALGGLNEAIAQSPVEKLREEQSELNILVGALMETNKGEAARATLIQQINASYPNFLKGIDLEKVSNEKLKQSLIDVNDQYEVKIQSLIVEQALSSLTEKQNENARKQLLTLKAIAEAKAEGVVKDEQGNELFFVSQKKIDGLYKQREAQQNEAKKDLADQIELQKELKNSLDEVSKLSFFTENPAKAVEETNTVVAMTAAEIKAVAEGMEEALKLAKEFDSLDRPDLIVDVQTRTTGSFDDDARLQEIQDFEDKKLEILNESREEGFVKETEDQIAHYENLDELAEENAKKQRQLAYDTGLSIFDTLLMYSDYKIAMLEQEKNKELELAGDNKVRQAQIEKEFGEKIKAEKLKAFKIQKAANIIQATMNATLGVTGALALGPPSSLVLAPIMKALGAAQVGIIAATPPPKFEKGGRIGGKLHRNGGTLIEAELDEHVINRKATAKYGHGLFDKINSLELNPDILSGKSGGATVNIVDTTPIAKALAGQRQTHINIDEDGFTLKQQKNQTTMIQKLKRYST